MTYDVVLAATSTGEQVTAGPPAPSPPLTKEP